MVKRMDAINHEIKIDATPEIVFKALSTRNGIKSWFTSTVEGTGAVGSEWKLHFKDKLEFHAAFGGTLDDYMDMARTINLLVHESIDRLRTEQC